MVPTTMRNPGGSNCANEQRHHPRRRPTTTAMRSQRYHVDHCSVVVVVTVVGDGGGGLGHCCYSPRRRRRWRRRVPVATETDSPCHLFQVQGPYRPRRRPHRRRYRRSRRSHGIPPKRKLQPSLSPLPPSQHSADDAATIENVHNPRSSNRPSRSTAATTVTITESPTMNHVVFLTIVDGDPFHCYCCPRHHRHCHRHYRCHRHRHRHVVRRGPIATVSR